MRVVLFGMPCEASAVTLQALLDAGCRMAGVAVAGASPRARDPLSRIAARTRLPVVTMRAASPWAEAATIAAWRPDAIVVSCFPWRIPASILNLPPLGCLNVHPSLLPVGRGPEPVFWTLRRGERETGTTIHLMDEGFDTGPIVAQARLPVPFGVRAPDLERQLAETGGWLLVEAIARLEDGAAQPHAQNSTLATLAPVPREDDYLIPTSLPASWAYGFARGVSPLGGPLAVWVGATRERMPVSDALKWDTAPMVEPYAMTDSTITVRFRPGHVVFERRLC